MATPLRPPAAAPSTSVEPAATPIGRCPSRHILPNRTADRPSVAPTDKSIPPVTITAVIASEVSFSSVASRRTRAALAGVAKRWPTVENKATLTSTKPASTRCGGGGLSGGTSAMRCPPAGHRVGGHGQQDDGPLHGQLPLRVDVQELQGRPDRGQAAGTPPQAENCDPTLMSTYRASRTSVMPTAAVSVGAEATHPSRNWPRKNVGRATANVASSAA